ncbi:MAG: DUF368 domain-containing protein [Planctomycetota bacterium]
MTSRTSEPAAYQPTPEPDCVPTPPAPMFARVLRLGVGGAMMGLANLVPGISGGTMLVAAGVYRDFVDAVSDATRLRISRGMLLTLAAIAGAAGVAIVLGARPVAFGLEHARWAMYALFIGLTIGGVPALLALVRPLDARVLGFAALGLLAMIGIVITQESGATGGATSGWPFLVLAGAAGAAAMVLPGVSGAYLLLLLGQYESVVSAIKDLASGDRAAAIRTLIPVGIGVALGIALVANALRWLLHRCERPTLAVLLGLLVGAPAGLYPFREAVPPVPGDVIDGEVVTAENQSEFDAEDWPTRAFTPGVGHVAGALALVGVGCGLTIAVGHLGRRRDA